MKKCLTLVLEWLKLITVEPSMVLYILASMTTIVVEQAFFVDKACRVNHNFNATICDNIAAEGNEEFNKVVQITVSEFQQWNDIAGQGGQIILALFIGAWSDKRGRKIPLLLGLIGKCVYSSMIIVNTLQYSWPVEYIIYTATIPMTITGADVAIYAAAFSYLVDVTKPESRTLRLTIMEVSYLAAMPMGTALGSALFTATNNSHTILFIINSSLLLIAIIYTAIRLDFQSSETQRPISEAKNVVTDFFDYKHVVSTFTTLFKKRLFNRRMYLLLLILAMAAYTFQRDERQMSYLYLQWVLKWCFDQISNFRTYQYATQDVALLIAIPLMSKAFGFRDTIIALIGPVASIIARILYAIAVDSWLFYLGGAIASLGTVVTPIIRSITSKVVPIAERGQAFTVLAVAGNAMPILSAIIYNQVYKKYLETQPQGIFYVTIGSELIVLGAFLIIHFTSTSEAFTADEKSDSHCLGNDNNIEQDP